MNIFLILGFLRWNGTLVYSMALLPTAQNLTLHRRFTELSGALRDPPNRPTGYRHSRSVTFEQGLSQGGVTRPLVCVVCMVLCPPSTEIHSFFSPPPPCTPERTLQGGKKSYILPDFGQKHIFFSRLRRVLGYPLSIKTCFLAFSEYLLFFVQLKNIFSHHKVKNFFVCDGWPQSIPKRNKYWNTIHCVAEL